MSEKDEKNNTEEVKKNETAEVLKEEASNTVNQVKDTFKNANVKEDSIAAKNFVLEMISKPASKIKEVVKDKTGKTFKYAIVILAVWIISAVLGRIIAGVFSLPAGTAIWSLVKAIISPLLGVIVFSILVLLFNKNNKKSLTTIISTVVIANVPNVIAVIVSLLNVIPGKIYMITSPICVLCTVLSTILLYFSVKSLMDKDDNESIKTFVIIEAIYLVVDFILSFIEIGI